MYDIRWALTAEQDFSRRCLARSRSGTMVGRTTVTCLAVLSLFAPAVLAQLEPRPIVEHLGMLMWADEVANFQVGPLRRCVPGCQGAARAYLYPPPQTARRRGGALYVTQEAEPSVAQQGRQMCR